MRYKFQICVCVFFTHIHTSFDQIINLWNIFFFQSENQENAHVSNEKHAVVYAITESQKRDRSPLHPIELNFPHRQSVASGAPKTDSGLQLRESWKRQVYTL